MKGMPSVAAKSEPSYTLLDFCSRMNAVLETKICKSSLILRIKNISLDVFSFTSNKDFVAA